MKSYKYDTKTLTYVPDNSKYRFLIVAILLLILVNVFVYHFVDDEKLNDIKYISEETKMMIINEDRVFTEDKLKQFILELNIRFPHIVYAQARLESGYFKSKIFRTNNNFFGMKVARKRPTTNKGEQYGHAYFDSWRDCVVDYAFYQAAYLHDIKTEDQYYAYLSANYAEDPNYVSKLKTIVKLNLQKN